MVDRPAHSEERVGRAEERHRQLMRNIDYVIGMIREAEKQSASGSGAPASKSALE